MTAATRDAFRENTLVAEKISILIDEIASASEEQSQGINQVSQAVAEMDRIVQQNAAAAEESGRGLRGIACPGSSNERHGG